jgi:hypothetical protein
MASGVVASRESNPGTGGGNVELATASAKLLSTASAAVQGNQTRAVARRGRLRVMELGYSSDPCRPSSPTRSFSDSRAKPCLGFRG